MSYTGTERKTLKTHNFGERMGNSIINNLNIIVICNYGTSCCLKDKVN